MLPRKHGSFHPGLEADSLPSGKAQDALMKSVEKAYGSDSDWGGDGTRIPFNVWRSSGTHRAGTIEGRSERVVAVVVVLVVVKHQQW
jgi:hypothetical protein